MEKKEYVKPNVEVLLLESECTILAGSDSLGQRPIVAIMLQEKIHLAAFGLLVLACLMRIKLKVN